MLRGTHTPLSISINYLPRNVELVQEKNKVNQHVYFISKVFKRVKFRYHKIERLALVVVINAGKLIL